MLATFIICNILGALKFALQSLRMKRVLLFDIDGTLTRSVYKTGSRNPILDAMSQVFGRTITKNGVIFSGGTDRSIIRVVVKFWPSSIV